MNKNLKIAIIIAGAALAIFTSGYFFVALAYLADFFNGNLFHFFYQPLTTSVLDGGYALLATWYVINQLFEQPVKDQISPKKNILLILAFVLSLVVLIPLFFIQVSLGLSGGKLPSLGETITGLSPTVFFLLVTWTMLYNALNSISNINKPKNTESARSIPYLNLVVILLTTFIIAIFWITVLKLFL